MKLIGISLLVVAALSWAPTAYGYSPECTSHEHTDTQTAGGVDHPDIPNCVVHPKHPYPNGVCEHVVVFTTTTGFASCAAEP